MLCINEKEKYKDRGTKDHLIGSASCLLALSINSTKHFKCVIKYKLSLQPLAVQWSSLVSAEAFAEQGFAVSLFFLGQKN